MQLPVPNRRNRTYLGLLLAALLSFTLTLCLPAMVTQAKGQPTATIAQTSPATLLQTGIQHYEAAQYPIAIQTWQQALQQTNPPADLLTKALLLSNLSLAHQHLSQWPQATATITQSLTLLETADITPATLETLAKAWNTKGRLHWGKGEMVDALSAWRKATDAYQQAGYQPGVLKSLLNQIKALQVQGLFLQAKEILESTIYPLLADEQLDPTLKANGWWQLGNAQRQFGNLSESQISLNESLTIINAQQLNTLRGPVLLDAGNTEVALANRARAIGKRKEAKGHQAAALDFYQRSAQASSAMTQLQARLNQLSLVTKTKKWTEAEALWPNLLPQISQLPPSRTNIYTQLHFAKRLTDILSANTPQQKQLNADQTITTAITPKAIDTVLARAIDQAKTLDDPIALSYGIGQRGELYESLGQWQSAQALTQQALQLTEISQYPTGRYRWEWQLGRLLNEQGKQSAAIKAYKTAVTTLESVRDNLLFIDAEVQFSFRDNVEPVYRELVNLLLSPENGATPDDATLDFAIKQLDNLQLSELENFLRCDLGSTAIISQFEANADTAIIYPIILPERLGVILQLQDQKIFKSFDVDKTIVKATLKELRKELSKAPQRTPEVNAAAKKVYQWLMQGIEPDLSAANIETLVFVLDGPLRNIPMAVLHDGNQYLVEKYAIAVAPELELFAPRPFTQDLTVFTGGVGSSQQIEERKFPAIDMLDAELNRISELFGPHPPLTNENFQPETLEQAISTGDFSGIHIKTHGEFSSNPDETFIVAHEKLIRGQELGELIQTASRAGETPIELLVLSACSTANGDNRAILGLAGITVRAGARSTLSTLWEAQDTPNTKLMIRFYEELNQPGTSRAQALQKAQLALMNEGYQAPYIWATYVLVGNWQ